MNKNKNLKKVLDKGFLEVIDHLGSDLTVVNSARVSFGKRKTTLSDGDKILIKYLVENKHYSPFRHLIVQFHIKAPEFVMRQWYKHVVGIETTSSYPTKDHGWNEISGRYVPVNDFYEPMFWRAQSQDNKQASEGTIDKQDAATHTFQRAMMVLLEAYTRLLELGVAKEQARILLPLNQYSEIYWTASFQAIMNFIELRDDKHAQWEIREYALAMKDLVYNLYPETTQIWLEVMNTMKKLTDSGKTIK
jgi:thymidylate synthase (FAD)